ncbi:MAG TPA: hypothetical protein VHZ50_05940 [Puia sp.]|jgi:hypothetical protein|nr:hypothetical protein [Puia sp.]
MADKNHRVAVVYLMWMPYGIEYFNSFIRSYSQNPAGADHQLYIIFNGVDESGVPGEYKKNLQEYAINYIAITMQNGQDIDAYLFAAKRVEADIFLFLNTYSILLANNWLKNYTDAFDFPGVGLVGATGSFQSYYSAVFVNNALAWESDKSFKENYRKYKLLIKTIFYWRLLFKPFPNPHIRTNAFMVRREVFLKITKQKLTSKFKAYQFESGRNSFTTQIINMGLQVLLVDRNGKTFDLTNWKNSYVFWRGKQEGLLVSDNQTKRYEEDEKDNRKKLTFLAWGVYE